MDQLPQILIVDDDKDILATVDEFLTLNGFNCQNVPTAEQALALMEQEQFMAVISDIMLPGMDGLELCRRITKEYRADVILITGYSDDYCYEEAIASGARDFIFKPVRLEELLLRLKRVIRERKLEKDRSAMMLKLKKLAITDDLTGLFNFRHFYAQLESETARAKRYCSPLSLILMDIDHFKLFNDKYGHLEGDKVLARIAQITKFCLRATDSAYRYGGEEFTIILPETTIDEAQMVADRIRANIESETFMPVGEAPVTITISIGVTQYSANEKLSTFIKRSDEAMYTSKQNGRNRVSCISGVI